MCAAVVILCCCAAQAKPEIMPLYKVKAGMTGYGRTVYSGLKVERFPIVVKGVLKGAGMSGDSMILIELTGPDAEKRGGVSMGMSGSPIYINDKIIGALAVTFPKTDHKLGGVTPIETMMKVKKHDEARKGLVPIKEPLKYGGREYRWIRYGKAEGDGRADVLEARCALAPVAIHGVSARTYPIIRKFFEDSGVEIQPMDGLSVGGAPMESAVGAAGAIEPGSSVSVQLVRGDIDISAAGTVTMVDGKEVYLFGHPFFRKGSVRYLLADAYVHAIVNSDEMPFKVTSTGVMRGEVVEDRGSALFGRLGSFPRMIPVKIAITNRDIDKTETFSFKIVRDEDILTNLIVMVLLQSLDNMLDRIGNGTAAISFSLGCEGCETQIKRENMFYDRYDISARSLTELITALGMVQDNIFTNSPVASLDIFVQIDSTHSFASIEKAEIVERTGPGGRKVDEGTTDKPDERKETKDTGSLSVTASATVTFGEADKTTAGPEEDTTAAQDWNEEEGAYAGEDESYGDGEMTPDRDETPEGMTEQSAAAAGDETTVEAAAEKEKTGGKDKKNGITVVRPGEKLGIKVRLRPYRQETVEETIFLKVPPDMSPGNAVINVFSGTRGQQAVAPGAFLIKINVEGPQQREQESETEYEGEEEEIDKSFDELVRKFNERDLNNELVASISPLGFDLQDENEPVKGKGKKTKKEEENERKAKKKTPWVLEGSATIKVRVESGSEPAKGAFKRRVIKKSKINTMHAK